MTNETQSEYINVNIKDKETGKLIGKQRMRNNIFRETKGKTSKLRYMYLKFLEKLINMLMSHADNNLEHRRRFNRVHKYVKQWIVHKGLRVCDRIIGKHMIRSIEDIPALAHNNHQRILFQSWMDALDDLWVLHVYQQALLNKDENKRKKFASISSEEYLKTVHKNNRPSHNGRKLMMQLYMTEVLEDTADRTMSDCLVMRLAHHVMDLYNVNPEERKKVPMPGEYPIYLADKEKNQPFFVSFTGAPIWYQDGVKDPEILTETEQETKEKGVDKQ